MLACSCYFALLVVTATIHLRIRRMMKRYLNNSTISTCRLILLGRRHHYASTSYACLNNNDGDVHPRQYIKSNETASKQKRHQQYAQYTKPKSQQFEAPFSAFISCLPGLEPLLLKEVEYLRSHWSSNDCEASKRSKEKPHILR